MTDHRHGLSSRCTNPSRLNVEGARKPSITRPADALNSELPFQTRDAKPAQRGRGRESSCRTSISSQLLQALSCTRNSERSLGLWGTLHKSKPQNIQPRDPKPFHPARASLTTCVTTDLPCPPGLYEHPSKPARP